MRKLKIRKNYKISKILLGALFLVFFLTFILFKIYSDNISPKIIGIANLKLKRFTESFLSNNIGYDILNSDVIDDILVVNKNSDGEILYVDYDLDHAYQALDVVTTTLNDLLIDLEDGLITNNTDSDIFSSKYGLVMKLPLLGGSNSAFLANLGPKIYFKINFVGSLLTNIKSKIVNYGMNNALVELYVTIKISEEIIAPFVNGEQLIEYDVLIASKVINGRVPEFYGGTILGESNLLSIPIE